MATIAPNDGSATNDPEGIRPSSGIGSPGTPSRPFGPAEEAARLAALRRMKFAATGLLVLAAVIYVIAHALEPAHPWLGFVRATAEASLVGGIADWFAVTALFRHPLGIPIPHTAIMQTQKDRIGRILGNFVQNHFLSREVLSTRLRAIRPAARMGEWLSSPDQAARLSHQLAGALSRTVEVLPDAEVRALIHRGATDRLEKIKLAPLLGDVLAIATAGSWPQDLLDQVLRIVGDAAQSGRESIRERVREESPRWVPGPVKDAVAAKMVSGFERFVAQVADDPDHPLRARFDDLLLQFIERLRYSPELNAQAEAMKADLIAHPMIGDMADSIWDRVRKAAARYRADPGAASLAPVEAALVSVGESLAESEQLRNDVDAFLSNVASAFLEQHRHEVADLIAATVRDWDPELAASRIELAVGRDLQFIRLNGTLVGGFAGLVIYVLSRFF
ncbi:MAG: DUF445 domain-containing protein [Gemmatimonadales bacterium]